MTTLPDIPPYSINKADKEKLLSPILTALSRHHYSCCPPYRKMMDAIGFDPARDYPYPCLPFLPVQLFGMLELRSLPQEKIVRTLTSSGTSGKMRSQVFLGRETAANQLNVLERIVSSFIGSRRMPMIIIDSESILKNRKQLSARAAGVLGFSLFGSERVFVLNDKMEPNHSLLESFLKAHRDGPMLIFGFTYHVYRFFFKELEKSGLHPDLSNAVLIHGGGWKKMEQESVSPAVFRKSASEVCGIHRVHDYYGMAEQTGTIHMECEYGHYHTPVWGDVIIRRPLDFSPAGIGEEGIIEVLSILPVSYPGHALLTDDTGILLGEDDCLCGRLGKYFNITGRIEQACLKGCSDAYEE